MRGKGLDHLPIPLTLKAHGDFLESWNSKGITLGNEARTSVWEVGRQVGRLSRNLKRADYPHEWQTDS